MTSFEVLGQTVTLPVEVRDASSATVMFEVDAAAAQALSPFPVVESSPGRAQIALALVDYRDNDLGSYHEVGVIFFVQPEGREPGNYIRHLPVDQEFTNVAGNLIWGFPKSVQQIDVTSTETSSRWVLTMDGELVVDVTVPRGGTDEMPQMQMQTYTVREGVPCGTAFAQGGTGSLLTIGGDGVTIALGTHPVAKELASLGLPDAPVVLTTWLEHMQATFGEALPL
ncbi:MAG TPA: acetoacetate decarboxylase family protein [Mycobacteriales bacterium]|nr:acetoacetate decarboxylase family protein [Mycobacteriales bacterium]